jgi:anti-sigma B factor antagonist
MAEFNTILKEQGDVSIIRLKVLENKFNELISNNRYKIVVDFQDLAYISSAGLGVFMAYIEKVRENQGDIKLTSMTDKVYNIFDLLGFPLLYEIFKTEEEAIKKFSE